MKLKDIAHKANVSVATVSRVINNSAGVDQGKVDRIRKVLEQNEYLPNTIARSLASKVTKTVGIMTPDIRHFNCSPIAYSVERTMNEQNYNTLLCNTGADLDNQIRYLKSLVSRKIDGVFLIGFSYSRPEFGEAIAKYLAGIPVVMLNANLKLPNIINVFGSSDDATREIALHLLGLGHRRIAFVKEPGSWVQDMKEKVFRETLRGRGCRLDPRYVYTLDSRECPEEVVEYLEREVRDYTAVVLNNDLVACGVVKYLAERGKRVPEDVSVVGYHNLEYSRYLVPALTTVDNHMEQMGAVMAGALLGRLRGKRVPRTIRTPVELIVRDSTGRAKKKKI